MFATIGKLADALQTTLYDCGHALAWTAVRSACQDEDRDSLLSALGYAQGAAETVLLLTRPGERAHDIARVLANAAALAGARVRDHKEALTEGHLAAYTRDLAGLALLVA